MASTWNSMKSAINPAFQMKEVWITRYVSHRYEKNFRMIMEAVPEGGGRVEIPYNRNPLKKDFVLRLQQTVPGSVTLEKFFNIIDNPSEKPSFSLYCASMSAMPLPAERASQPSLYTVPPPSMISPCPCQKKKRSWSESTLENASRYKNGCITPASVK